MPRRVQDRDEAERIAQRVGARLRQHRGRLGWSQEQTGERVGITPEAYGRIERGVSLPSFPTLLSLCREFGVRPDELLLEPQPDLVHATEVEARRRQACEQIRRLDTAELEAIEPLLRLLTSNAT